MAKENGSWTIFDEAEALIIPDDLSAALDGNPEAKAYYTGLSKSGKKIYCNGLRSPNAKKPEINAS